MTKTEIEIIRGLKSKGYAVVLITPEELKGANPDDVEDNLISESWEIIECLLDEQINEEI
jgi:hypothetical protein